MHNAVPVNIARYLGVSNKDESEIDSIDYLNLYRLVGLMNLFSNHAN